MDFMKFIPFGAGMAPAGIVGLELYKGLSDAALPVFSAATPFVAAPVAVVGVAAMMAGEIWSYEKAFEAFARKEKGIGALSFAVGLVCSALVTYAIVNAEGSRAVMVSAVIVSVLIYVVGGIAKYLKTREDDAKKALEQKKLNIESEKTAVNLARANARLAEASVRQAEAERLPVSTGQGVMSTGQKPKKFTPELLARVRAYYESNPNCSGREVAAALNVSHQTGVDYLKEAKK